MAKNKFLSGVGGVFTKKESKDIGNQFLKQTNSYAGSGENTPRSMDQVIDLGLLGDFANKIDNSAQRSYVESGYISNVRPRSLETLMQEPDMTIIIKKRMFSSLIDNYRIDMMDKAERNFIRACKRLFQNKCQVISTYERLSKLEKIIQNKGVLNDFMSPLLISGIETLESFGINIVDEKTKVALDTVRKMQAFSDPGNLTTWFVNPAEPFDLGEGEGTFSITTAASVNTTVSTQFGGGKCNLTIEDPYHLMNINEADIDRAISDIYNKKQSSSLFQFSENELTKQNNDTRIQLNSIRETRGATPIVWQTNDNSILGQRVRAFIDQEGREIIFNFDPGLVGIGAKIDLDPSAIEGKNGLVGDEIKLFERITKNIYLILNLQRQREQDTDVIGEEDQSEIDYIRSKMRLQFVNKNIIQVMDTVHIFLGSKTMVDSKTIGFDTNSNNPGNILTMLNSTIENVEQTFNNIGGFFSGGSKNSYVDIEKEAIVGADFPTWLWVALRNDFTRQAAGTHVFAGLVSSVNENYSGGKYTLSVSCQDNTEYFKMGQINVKPAVDVPERSVFDPLTPFDLEFDGATGFLVNTHPKLLSENERLLLSGVVKFKNGSRFIGSPMSEFLYLLGSDDFKSATGVNKTQKVFFDPDGFVYRWKSGIGTFTYSGSRHPDNTFRKASSPSLTKNPFAGQDVMNVLSLLITGVPYNYNTFITSSIKNANLSFFENKDNLSNLEMSRSFMRSFISDLQVNNQIWGNFVPFKKLVMNESSLRFAVSGQFSYQKNSSELDQLLFTRAKLFDTLAMADAVFANNPNIYGVSLNGELNKENISQSTVKAIAFGDKNIPLAVDQLFYLDQQISALQSQVYKSISSNDGTMQVFGDDISFSPDLDGIGNQVGEEEKEKSRALLRRKMKLLTQRRLWKVSANDDQNLLIIDDQYDKDYDIQSFERALAGRLNLLKSDYKDAATEISSVAKILGLEVFANTQGHIEIKPPGYNKVPSSVFYKMISDGKKLYPKTLETLFIDQADGLIDRLKIVEDQIRLRTLAMGINNDAEASMFLSSVSSTSYSFRFITNEFGEFGVKPTTIRALVAQDSPDQRESIEFKALKTTTKEIASQLKQQAIFDTATQVKAVFDSRRVMPADFTVQSSYDQVRTRLMISTGQPVPAMSDLIGARNNQSPSIGPVNSQTSILKLTKEISAYISERQNVLKLLRNAFRNLEQGALVDEDPTTRRNIIFPNFQRKKETPSIIQHLIEDEEEDDLGMGSGGRYIIKDNQIISFSISENKPQFTTIEVNGLPGEGFIDPIQNGEIGFGGNLQTSAIAVDYDLWRMYGFSVGNTVPAPYISDPEAQAAPLATWLLTEQRRKLISGSMEIAGNEFMQPGEVVYIEDRDLLFYVESVSHNFNFGSNFTTSLTLTYGHNPGEYFPTMLDVIGKGLYSKRNQANKIRNARHGYANGDQHLGVIIIDTQSQSFVANPASVGSLVLGKYGDQNKATLTQIILALKGSQISNEEEANVEIRFYSNPSKGYTEDANLRTKAESVKSWLKNPTRSSFGIDGLTESDSLRFPANTVNSFNNAISTGVNKLLGKSKEVADNLTDGLKIEDVDKLVNVRHIELTDPEGPSPKAWLAARESSSQGIDNLGSFDDITGEKIKGRKKNKNITPKSMSNSMKSNLQFSTTSEERTLYRTILDVWVSLKPVEETTE